MMILRMMNTVYVIVITIITATSTVTATSRIQNSTTTALATIVGHELFHQGKADNALDFVILNSNHLKASDGTESSESESHSWAFPLMLSFLAGASTCIGAAVVFCFPPSTIRRSMSFSLSLAASVMITISVVSILPEVLRGMVEYSDTDTNHTNSTITDQDTSNTGPLAQTTRTIVHTTLIMERLFSFLLGVVAYLLLSKLLVFLPDPENLYLLDGDEEKEIEDNKRNYDLYLSDDDNEDNHGDGDDSESSHSTSSAPLLVVRRRNNNNATNNSDDNTYDEYNDEEDLSAFSKERRKRSWRVAIMLFASLLLHNFPEGLCVVSTNTADFLCTFRTIALYRIKIKIYLFYTIYIYIYIYLILYAEDNVLPIHISTTHSIFLYLTKINKAASAKESPELGITVAIGIFIHNVPEGIAISGTFFQVFMNIFSH